MAYEAGALDATLAAAAGDDPLLFSELRQAFIESVARQLDLLRRSRCDGNWQVAALRLKGIAATFHAERLIALADEAADGAPGDPAVLRRMQTFIDEFAAV
ncbi:MAG TPA: Hpt domain-containing protein [Novosphingobium sp.]|nr:Hpt domain-containing protein [Novosphingobium sp.]HQA17590.1 Hpt domain-containing protein [Novosphingobium sp.]